MHGGRRAAPCTNLAHEQARVNRGFEDGDLFLISPRCGQDCFKAVNESWIKVCSGCGHFEKEHITSSDDIGLLDRSHAGCGNLRHGLRCLSGGTERLAEGYRIAGRAGARAESNDFSQGWLNGRFHLIGYCVEIRPVKAPSCLCNIGDELVLRIRSSHAEEQQCCAEHCR